jgi:hypothetical protein
VNEVINNYRAEAIVFAFEDDLPGFQYKLAQAVADSDGANGYVLVKRSGLELFQEAIEDAERAGELEGLPRVGGIGRAIKAFLTAMENPQKEMKL